MAVKLSSPRYAPNNNNSSCLSLGEPWYFNDSDMRSIKLDNCFFDRSGTSDISGIKRTATFESIETFSFESSLKICDPVYNAFFTACLNKLVRIISEVCFLETPYKSEPFDSKISLENLLN